MPAPQEERVLYVCSVCGGAFESSGGVVAHMTTQHRQLPAIRRLLRQARALKEEQGKKKKGRKHKKLFRCGQCPYKTTHVTSFKRHELWHNKEFQYKCPHCPYKAIQAHNVRCHVQSMHSVVHAVDLALIKERAATTNTAMGSNACTAASVGASEDGYVCHFK